jgi:hypothetical protein
MVCGSHKEQRVESQLTSGKCHRTEHCDNLCRGDKAEFEAQSLDSTAINVQGLTLNLTFNDQLNDLSH